MPQTLSLRMIVDEIITYRYIHTGNMTVQIKRYLIGIYNLQSGWYPSVLPMRNVGAMFRALGRGIKRSPPNTHQTRYYRDLTVHITTTSVLYHPSVRTPRISRIIGSHWFNSKRCRPYLHCSYTTKISGVRVQKIARIQRVIRQAPFMLRI